MGKVFEIDQSKSGKSKKSNRTKKAKETLVQFILDETGSMDFVRDATIDGFNEYVNGLRNDKKNKYRLALTKFDSRRIVDVFGKFLPIDEFPNLTREMYAPNAMTNLNDAIGTTITNMERKYGGKKDVNYLVVIMTDGLENASREWTAEACQELIRKQEREGWTITFLGANMDAQKVANTYSIQAGNAKSYSVTNMSATMRGLSETTQVYASNTVAGCASTDFFSGTDDWTKDEAPKSNPNAETTLVVPSLDISKASLGGNAYFTQDEADKWNKSQTIASANEWLDKVKREKSGGKDNG